MRIAKILIIAWLSLLLTACGTNIFSGAGTGGPQAGKTPKLAAPGAQTPGNVEISFDFIRNFKIASDQLAVWVEDEQGKHIRTLLVTKFTAGGGYSKRPEAVPHWQKAFQPEKANSAAFDAISSATLQTGRISVFWDCRDQNGKPVPAGHYIYKVEANIEWRKVDLWRGDIIIGAAPSQADASLIQGDGSELKAVRASFLPAN